jgi:L-iditol 2-dehydrogenase
VESRVAFALVHGFADVGHVVKAERPSDTEESMLAVKSTARAISALQLPDGRALGQTDFSFECTGVEVCVQTAIYVSYAWLYIYTSSV